VIFLAWNNLKIGPYSYEISRPDFCFSLDCSKNLMIRNFNGINMLTKLRFLYICLTLQFYLGDKTNGNTRAEFVMFLEH
jgi:hypothetical protein